jgi:hypothetical protein
MVYKNAASKIHSRGMQLHKSNKTPLNGANILAVKKDAGVYAPLIKIYKVN